MHMYKWLACSGILMAVYAPVLVFQCSKLAMDVGEQAVLGVIVITTQYLT